MNLAEVTEVAPLSGMCSDVVLQAERGREPLVTQVARELSLSVVHRAQVLLEGRTAPKLRPAHGARKRGFLGVGLPVVAEMTPNPEPPFANLTPERSLVGMSTNMTFQLVRGQECLVNQPINQSFVPDQRRR